MARREPKRTGSIMSGFDTSKYSLTNDYGILEPHEPIGGDSRKQSIEEGLYLYTTRENHSRLHIEEDGMKENEELKILAQECWMKKKKQDSHKHDDNVLLQLWVQKFTRNYI